ncbi:MAG: transcriptional regulator [Neorhizobium sp.]|nr:transcriptional regulator [Neorhizobium sp.]
MLQPSKIVVYVPDEALRLSLAFALEVEGYRVEAHAAWNASASFASGLLCRIIDEQVLRADAGARDYMRGADGAVILLSDGLTVPPQADRANVLAKPFEGSDLVRMVRSFPAVA